MLPQKVTGSKEVERFVFDVNEQEVFYHLSEINFALLILL